MIVRVKTPLRFGSGATQPHAAKVDSRVLIQVAICIVPAMIMLRLQMYTLGARYFFGAFLILFCYTLTERDAKKITCLVLGCLQVLMMWRDFLSYSSVEVLLTITVGLWFAWARSDFDHVFQNPVVRSLVAFSCVYWLLSVALTGSYWENLRIFELTFAAVCVCLLGKYREYLATAFLGAVIAGFGAGLAMVGQGERLGMIRNDETRFGNPISFGAPMALIILLTIADDGRWMALNHRRWLRWTINIAAGMFVLLSTSRGSWSVVAAGVVVMLLLSRHRMRIAAAVLVAAIAIGIWLRAANPEVVDKYFYKTFESDEEWSHLNARVAQWDAFPDAFAQSPIWGFGPGRGRGVSTIYSGHNLIWHSLYLQIGIECGSIGLLLLAALLISQVYRSLRHLYVHKEIVPLLGIVGFMTIGVSVPGIDGISGLFLGLSMLSGSSPRGAIFRLVPVRLPEEVITAGTEG